MYNSKKKRLTHKQYQLLRLQHRDTCTADAWLAQQGINADVFVNTHTSLLQAQQQAHAHITQNNHLLTNTQRNAFNQFLHHMSRKDKRNKLKPTAAQPILNISNQVRRHMFKLNRQIHKA